MREDVFIPTAEGAARAFAFTPSTGDGPWPTVIIYMDAVGIRPALFEMGQRLADAGYYVLLPDIFWRAAPYDLPDVPKILAGDPEASATFQKLLSSTSPARQVSDTAACLEWLGTQPQAKADRVGITGYCMGGPITLRVAGSFPDRVAASAAFHGGHMATDDPDSPHRLSPAIKARVLVAGADSDPSFDEAQKDRLTAALDDAGVDAEVTIWPGCLHGWVPTDSPVHNPEGAERHWRELTDLFDATLG